MSFAHPFLFSLYVVCTDDNTIDKSLLAFYSKATAVNSLPRCRETELRKGRVLLVYYTINTFVLSCMINYY